MQTISQVILMLTGALVVIVVVPVSGAHFPVTSHSPFEHISLPSKPVQFPPARIFDKHLEIFF
jgi:hypothetical protein